MKVVIRNVEGLLPDWFPDLCDSSFQWIWATLVIIKPIVFFPNCELPIIAHLKRWKSFHGL